MIKTLVIIILISFSCCSNDHNIKVPQNNRFDSSAIILNNHAMDLMINSYEGDNKSEIKQLLNEAIKIDSNFYPAYVNLSDILIQTNNLDSAFIVLKAAKALNENYLPVITKLAFLYDKNGDRINASKNYIKALKIYDEKVQKSTSDLLNKYLIMTMLYGKDSALVEVNNQINDSIKPFLLQNINDFNKDSFLGSY